MSVVMVKVLVSEFTWSHIFLQFSMPIKFTITLSGTTFFVAAFSASPLSSGLVGRCCTLKLECTYQLIY